MSKKLAENPFQTLEAEAYHAFREWPVWLALRERELATHLDIGKPRVPPAAQADREKPIIQPHQSAIDNRGG